MVNQYLSHSMPKSAGNPALFLTKGSGNGFNKIKGLAETSPYIANPGFECARGEGVLSRPDGWS
jgi:hypothetical protein